MNDSIPFYVNLFMVYGVIEIMMMKEKFSKWLLVEDMSSHGNSINFLTLR